MTGMLILARHGQSESNRENIFTGRADPPLTDEGRAEARFIASQIRHMGIHPDTIFTSALRRTRETAEIIDRELISAVPIVSDPALNERDYGGLTGMNKDEAACRFGEAQVLAWRRSYQERPPGGESLFDTRQRVTAYFGRNIMPLLKEGKNIVVVGHENCLRALAMGLEDLSPSRIESFEIATGQLIVYRIVASDHGVDAIAFDPRRPAAS